MFEAILLHQHIWAEVFFQKERILQEEDVAKFLKESFKKIYDKIIEIEKLQKHF